MRAWAWVEARLLAAGETLTNPTAMAAALALAVILSGASTAAAQTAEIVIDAETGAVLHERRSGETRRPASLTKLMTLYLTFEALRDRRLTLDRELVASQRAAAAPATHLGLRRGERITVRDAIRAAAIRSANDAAVVLAEAIGGTEENFARMMTERARALGMRDTSFGNASGLPHRRNQTTARDMARLVRALIRDFPAQYAVFSERRMRWGEGSRRNTNRLLGREPGVDGVKTGYTRRAGWCLASSAVRSGRRVIVVYLGGPTRIARDARVADLLDRGFERLPDRPAPLAPALAMRPAPAPNRMTDADAATVITWGPATPPAGERPDLAALAPAPSGARRWAIQLGAFGAPETARRELERLTDRHAPALRGAFHSVEAIEVETSGGEARRVWRVRFTGYDETDARSACRSIESSGDLCALVPPSGWPIPFASRG